MADTKIIKLNESTIKVVCELDTALLINDYFAFFAENYRWHPKFKAGIWDGKIRLFNMRKGHLPGGLLKKLLKLLKDANESFDLDPNFFIKKDEVNDEWIINLSKSLKCDFAPRDYQIAAIKEAINSMKAGILSPTGSGKSFIQFLIINAFFKLGYGKRVLLIVPTISLVEQMKFDFLEYAKEMPNYEKLIHVIYSGKSKDTKSPITISTWQSLGNLGKKFMEQFDCVLVDEFHTATAQVLNKIMTDAGNAKMRIGMSGTIQDSKVNAAQLEGLFGEIKRVTTTKDLMKNKTLAKLKIDVLVLKHPTETRRIVYNAKDYFEEMKVIREDPLRLYFISNLVIKGLKNENILLMFKNVEYGKMLYDVIKNAAAGSRNVHLVYGGTESELREKVRKMTIADKDAIIVASQGVFSTGVNIPNLQTVIFAQPGKSKIKVLQSIGRVLRKTDGKTRARLIDVVDDFTFNRKKNYAVKHALSRIEMYEKEGFEYQIRETVLDDKIIMDDKYNSERQLKKSNHKKLKGKV